MSPARAPTPTDVPELETAATLGKPALADYAKAASAYVLRSPTLGDKSKKAAQLKLSLVLGRVLAHDLQKAAPGLIGTSGDLVAGERKVSGALRTVNADVSELHRLDGLRLAVEIKPVNLAVGRAIWNRFGDIRTFAVNLHLRFPFAVVGGVLSIPTWEWTSGKTKQKKPTTHLIQRAITRLVRAGGRETEGDAAHLLEAVAVVVYDPDSGSISGTVPSPGSGLRWEEFVKALVAAYAARYEGQEEALKAMPSAEESAGGIDSEDPSSGANDPQGNGA